MEVMKKMAAVVDDQPRARRVYANGPRVFLPRHSRPLAENLVFLKARTQAIWLYRTPVLSRLASCRQSYTT